MFYEKRHAYPDLLPAEKVLQLVDIVVDVIREF